MQVLEAISTYFNATITNPCSDISKLCKDKAAQLPKAQKHCSPWEIARKQRQMMSPDISSYDYYPEPKVVYVITH